MPGVERRAHGAAAGGGSPGDAGGGPARRAVRVPDHRPPPRGTALGAADPAGARRLRAARPEPDPLRRQGREHHHVSAPDVAVRARQPRAPHPHLRRGGAAGRWGGPHRRPGHRGEEQPAGRTPTSSAPSSRTSSPTRTCRSAAGGCSGGSWGSPPSPRSPGLLGAPGSAGRGGLPRPRRRRRSRSAPGRRSMRSRPRGCPSAGCSASSTSG